MHGAQRRFEEWTGGRVATKVVVICVAYMLTLTHDLCGDARIIVHRGTSAASETSVDDIACRACGVLGCGHTLKRLLVRPSPLTCHNPTVTAERMRKMCRRANHPCDATLQLSVTYELVSAQTLQESAMLTKETTEIQDCDT
jgi:hypothetical protein